MTAHEGTSTITGFSESQDILTNPNFRVDHPFRSTRKIFGPTVLDTEGSTHIGRKRSWLSAFAPQNVASEPFQSAIKQSLSEGFDLAEAKNDLMLACTYIPNRVVLLLLGCADVDPLEHFERTRPLIQFLEDGERSAAVTDAKAYLKKRFIDQTSSLLMDLPEKDRMKELLVFAVAGSETTTVAFKNIMLHWAKRNKEFQEQAKVAGIDALILDILKADPPLGLATRYCGADASLGSKSYKKGDIVHVDIVEANKDCPVSGRKLGAKDLTFGIGRHACPGHLLAKAELKSAIEYLLKLDIRDYLVETHGIQDERPLNFRHPNETVIRKKM